uniref:Ubiquitin-like protease family profile domain-containing protein n=1 Tax=Romanomermis culicivorax TaxID=13658 RepID=A0A915K5Q0_ROMCU
VDTKNRRVSSSLDPNYAFEAEDEDEEDIEEAKEQYEQLKDASMSDSSSTQSQIYQLIPAMTCIIIMDSLLCGSPRYRTVGILRDYLTEEYAQKKNARQPKPQDDQQTNTTMPIFDRTNCRGIYPKVPQQDNYSDCGLYVLQFAESFLTEPPDDFGPTGLKKLQNLFPSEKVKNKRAEIRDILVRFFKNRTDRNSSKAEEASKSEILP